MPDSEGFSVEIPRTGAQIEYVEFGFGTKLLKTCTLALVKGPFRFPPDEVYECWTECGREIVLIHLNRRNELKGEKGHAFYIITGEMP